VTPAPKATLAPTQPIPTQAAPIIPPGGALYIVQPGDTLFDIAEKFNVPLQKLADVNHITDPTSIYPMQRLIIP
jgi:LysM repeat protein